MKVADKSAARAKAEAARRWGAREARKEDVVIASSIVPELAWMGYGTAVVRLWEKMLRAPRTLTWRVEGSIAGECANSETGARAPPPVSVHLSDTAGAAAPPWWRAGAWTGGRAPCPPRFTKGEQPGSALPWPSAIAVQYPMFAYGFVFTNPAPGLFTIWPYSAPAAKLKLSVLSRAVLRITRLSPATIEKPILFPLLVLPSM